MKILVISESLLDQINGDYYAVDTWIRLPQLLAAQEVSVTLWAPVRTGRVVPQPDSWRVDLGSLRIQHHEPYHSYATYFRSWVWRAHAWRRDAMQLISAHDVVILRLPSPMVMLISKAARRVKKPLVFMVAGDSLTQSDRIRASRGLKRLIYTWVTNLLIEQERRCAKRATLVYAYSQELAERHETSDRSVRRIRTPHLSLQDLVKRDDTCLSAEIRLLRVCWLVPSKGLEHLLKSVVVLRFRGYNVRLEIVGKERQGGYLDSLQAYADKLGIADTVTFSGWVPFDQIRDVYVRSDIQVISSLAEGTPRCIVEGAACGLPLVCTTAGGCADVLEHERTALLVPPGDAEALAIAIGKIIDDSDLRRALIAHGYQMARDATFDVMGVKLLRDLQNLVCTHHRAHFSSVH